MPILGAHESIAGGHDRAVETAHRLGCDCVQLFTRNATQWRAKEITPEETARFQQALGKTGVRHPLAHGSYLINLASPDPALWQRSIDAMAGELRRAAALGIPYVVIHPGAAMGGSEAAGLKRIAQALDEVHAQTRGLASRCLLETTAGPGTVLGGRFEHLATILDAVKDPQRLGVCFDTCHVFAAGYALAPRAAYRATWAEFDASVGLGQLRAFHLNDSRGAQGSRLDRHAAIGRGRLGIEPFRLLMRDRRFRNVPMYLETPKGAEDGEDLDTINLRTLRGLLRG